MITVNLSDGRTVNVQTNDRAVALEAAKKYLAENPTFSPTSSSIVEDAERIRSDARRRLADLAATRPVRPRETGFFEDLTTGFGSGVVGIGESIGLGAATLLEEEAELAARESIQSAADFIRPEGGDPESITYQVGQALGSIAGLGAIPIAAAAAPGVSAGAALGLGALAAGAAGTGEASERARAADATEEERGTVALRGFGIGLLDILPIARVVRYAELPKLNKLLDKFETISGDRLESARKIQGIGQRIKNAGITGVAETTQEAAAAALQNLNAREYDAAAEIFGLSEIEEATIGGTAGAILQGLVDLFAPRSRGSRDTSGPTTEEVLGLPAPEEVLGLPAPQRPEGRAPLASDDIAAGTEAASQARASARMGERQQDLFALQKEQAERRLGPAMREEPESVLQAERDRLFPEETPTEVPAAQRDMIDELETAQIEEAIAAGRRAAVAEDDAEIAGMLETEERIAAGVDAAETAQIERMVAQDTEQQKILDAAVADMSPYASVADTVVPPQAAAFEAEALAGLESQIKEKVEKDPTEPVSETGEQRNTLSEEDLQTLGEELASLNAQVPTLEGDALEAAIRRQEELVSIWTNSLNKEASEPKKRGRKQTKPKITQVNDTDFDVAYPDGSLERIRKEADGYISLNRTDFDYSDLPLALRGTRAQSVNYLTQLKNQETKLRDEVADTAASETTATSAEVEEPVVMRPLERAEFQKQIRLERENRKTTAEGKTLPAVREARREAEEQLDVIQERRKKKEEETGEETTPIDTDELAEDDGLELSFESIQAETELISPMPTLVKKALQGNQLRRALLDLSESSNDKFIQRTAKKLAEYTADTRVLLVPQTELGMKGEQVIDGRFVAADNTILLSEEFADTHTLLHEMTHAATINTLQNPSSPITTQLQNLRKQVQPYVSAYYGGMDAKKLEDQYLAEGMDSKQAKFRAETVALQEFVAEAFTNPVFQRELGRINIKGQELSAWQRLWNTIMNLIGLGRFGSKTAQREAELLTQQILAPALRHRYAPTLNSMTDRNGVTKIAEDIKARTKGIRTKEGREKIVRDYTSLFTRDSRPVQKAESVALGFLPNQAVQDIAEYKGVVGAKTVLDAIENQRGDLNFSEENTRRRLDPIVRWANKASENTTKTWNNLIYDSTIDEVDPKLTPKQAEDKYKDAVVDGTEQLKVDRHKELRAIYMSAALGKDGRKAYDDLRQFYKDQYNELINALNGRIDNSDLADSQKTTLKNELLAKMLERTDVEPYFPLTRSGTYWLSVKNPDQLSESAVFAFETSGDRVQAAEEYGKEGYEVEIFDPSDSGTYDQPAPGRFIAQVLNVLNVSKTDPVVKEQVMRLFLESLPESSFAKALLKRKKTPGFDVDAVEAARTKAYDLARQTERIKNTNTIERLKDNFLAANEGRGNDIIIKEIVDRAGFAVSPPNDSFAKNANRIAFLWTIGFNASSALVNLSQIPLFAYPMLGGKYGSKPTADAIGRATKIFMGSPNSRAAETLFGDARTPKSIKEALRSSEPGALLDAVKDKALPSLQNYYTLTRADDGTFVATVREGLNLPTTKDEADGKVSIEELNNIKPLVELAARRGQLNSSFLADTLSVDQSGRALKFYDKLTNLSALMFHEAEVMNRQVTLVAAYNLALNKLTGGEKPTLKQQQQAAEMAIHETQQINGGATLETGPRFARKGIPRIALMYKNYGIQMYYTMGKTAAILAKNLFPGNDAKSRQLRNEALRQLTGVHLSALFFAGAQGLPLYGLVSALYDILLVDDYEEDADTAFRGYLDNDMLFKGVLSEVSGLDVSERVKLTDLLFEADRFNSDPSPEEEFAHLFGGPAWSVYARGRKGFDKLGEGDILRGVEDLLPGAVRNALQALYRYPSEGGIRTRRGDPMYDDITTGDLLAKLMGFPPNEYTKAMDEVSAAKGLQDSARAKRAQLLKKYYIALRFGDNEGAVEALEEMEEFNRLEVISIDPDLIIDGDTIERSLRRHEATTAKMHNGILLSPNFKAAVEEVGFF